MTTRPHQRSATKQQQWIKSWSDLDRLDSGLLALMRCLGIQKRSDLASQEAYKLAAMMRYVNYREGFVRRTPHAQQLQIWIEQASTFKPEISQQAVSEQIERFAH